MLVPGMRVERKSDACLGSVVGFNSASGEYLYVFDDDQYRVVAGSDALVLVASQPQLVPGSSEVTDASHAQTLKYARQAGSLEALAEMVLSALTITTDALARGDMERADFELHMLKIITSAILSRAQEM